MEKEESESSAKPPISAQLVGENVEGKPEEEEEPLPAKKLKLVQPATVALSSPLRPAAETLVPSLATVALRSSPRKRRQEPPLEPPSSGSAGDGSSLKRGKEEDSNVERLNAASVSVEASTVSEQRPSTDEQLENGAPKVVNGESLPPKTPQIQASIVAAPDGLFVCLFLIPDTKMKLRPYFFFIKTQSLLCLKAEKPGLWIRIRSDRHHFDRCRTGLATTGTYALVIRVHFYLC